MINIRKLLITLGILACLAFITLAPKKAGNISGNMGYFSGNVGFNNATHEFIKKNSANENTDQPSLTVNKTSLLITTDYSNNLINLASVEIAGPAEKIISGRIENSGMIKITDTTVVYTGQVVNNGGYVSDPSNNYYYSNLIIGETGYLVGGPGDNFFLLSDLISSSTRNTDWNTVDAYLEFKTGLDSSHEFYITGADLGPTPAGYVNNFAWGQLHIAPGNTLILQEGNSAPGGGLYVEVISGVVVSGSAVTNITGNGINIYYAGDLPENSTLDGLTYDLTGGGQLIAVSPYCPTVDTDLDGICDSVDNCPSTPNPGQNDTDDDTIGNACDSCPFDPFNDVDGDTVCGDTDNCPIIANTNQADSDGDGLGNACDLCPLDPNNDADGDGYCSNEDNCPIYPNPDQTDTDGDGHGDLCPLADLDSDGDVDGGDLSEFSGLYDQEDLGADIEKDNVIDQYDVEKFGREFGWQR